MSHREIPISQATANNWTRLNTSSDGKLTSRANKRQSARQVTAMSYIHSNGINEFLKTVREKASSIDGLIYTLCLNKLHAKGILDRPSVKQALAPYRHLQQTDIDIPASLWEEDEDVIGFIYQSLLPEGRRNLLGQYYTHAQVVRHILSGMTLQPGERLLDPCCGSGAFLLGVDTDQPQNLYGVDIDSTAVLIARTNLLCRHAGTDFVPHIFCGDFLTSDRLFNPLCQELEAPFDIICTNPPWGADKEQHYAADFPMVKSKERASMFLIESLRLLKTGGVLKFLLPTSLLKINIHGDIRKLLLQSTTLTSIDFFDNRFDGVYTHFFCLSLTKQPAIRQRYTIVKNQDERQVMLSEADRRQGHIVVNPLNETEQGIIRKIEQKGVQNLSQSQWALGIVTGDNRHKLYPTPQPGLEPVIKGKQIHAFCIDEPEAYIKFVSSELQQCAPEALYRAPEKLIYRFIAKEPVVAYDDRQRLCLNSANILIPNLETISIASVAGLLNSELYRFCYRLHFHDIKVLKSNLLKLTFPILSAEEDAHIAQLVKSLSLSASPSLLNELNTWVYRFFGINSDEQAYIHKLLN